MMRPNFKTALRYIQQKHRGQVRAGNVPVWYHAARVSQLLRLVLENEKEGSSAERTAIIVAALGHDVLEDTNATEKEIAALFGSRGLKLIQGMTNPWGDNVHVPYVRKVASSEEGVRLIKLADLYDNMTSAMYNLHILGVKWAQGYFLPIVTPMWKAVTKTKFNTYKKSAGLLAGMVKISAKMFDEEMGRYKSGVR